MGGYRGGEATPRRFTPLGLTPPKATQTGTSFMPPLSGVPFSFLFSFLVDSCFLCFSCSEGGSLWPWGICHVAVGWNRGDLGCPPILGLESA